MECFGRSDARQLKRLEHDGQKGRVHEEEVGARVGELVEELGGRVGGVCEGCFYAGCGEAEEGYGEA